ncbi:hypothetical protein AB0L71_01730 [Streptomyces sp. NPDC052052]|uniref:hypothetical protein n=1 Tax=Streptomyces sp. NPDC052052 TaxID=3154756 RepID=UPI00341FA287
MIFGLDDPMAEVEGGPPPVGGRDVLECAVRERHVVRLPPFGPDSPIDRVGR